ncbi:IMPA4 [Symbiodinium sp. CCMP2592]|nr:IMPA4 [Symbiodinium sp. CCMP2456]CAE7767044.1 IMPA4 [Symbiodinium sp. CCMP2592]|eukprot:CAMPEP_0181433478 /NCGR_PEP_ID=MMETSP1110-20121109/19312_1 /TAXON_ID=174948 /ORGANISM="Symbiodinium sp., Strain CCMP421" /LENGTH=536 /DNA_ID=CAMNT_0023556931 /DNA_START=107 /DNA_END=1717 /DNA_ORIENTATION=+
MSGFGERLSQRQKAFKKGVDADDARRKREDAAVQLRKQTRDEALMKKRMVNDIPAAGQTTDPMALAQMGERMATVPSNCAVEQIPALSQALLSDDPQAQFNATQQFRKLLSIEQNPPISEVINAGVVPRFVQFLKEINRPDLQFEAAWVLTNIASGNADQTRVVVEQGALPIFVQLLQSPNDDVREQAVWALGNIAGDSPNFRDLVLQSGGLHPVMTVLRESEKTSMMRNATWTLSNLCRGKPPPPFEWVSPALGTLANLIYSCDCEVLTDACWALSYLSDGPNERITAVIQAGVCRRLVELLLHTSPLVQTPALRAVGNIVTGDDNQTQVILQSGALPSLLKLLSHAKKAIRKESCWTISNITAGNREQIQEVINNGLLPPVIHLLQTADFDIKKEAAWAISNATSGGSPQQVEYLVEMQCIKPLVDLLVVSDAKIIGVALEALENILKVGKDKQQKLGMAENPFAAKIEQADGLPKIENLQEDPNEEVYQKAMKILEKYFPLEDEDAEIGEDVSNPQQFQFGAQVPTGGFSFGS